MLILASTSKIRAAILKNAGVAFTVESPDLDEAELKSRLLPANAEQLALSLACAKAKAVANRHPQALALGADQVLVCGTRIYDKPRSISEARDHLLSLSGKPHQLVSGLCIRKGNGKMWNHVEAAILHMRELSPAAIDCYLEAVGNDVMTSVGAYKLEGRGVQLFDRIDGDYFTILGLPLLPLLSYLRTVGELAG